MAAIPNWIRLLKQPVKVLYCVNSKVLHVNIKECFTVFFQFFALVVAFLLPMPVQMRFGLEGLAAQTNEPFDVRVNKVHVHF